jgi:heptosyltransferase II
VATDRILVIRLTALGDVVLTEPVVRVLKSAFPGTAVDLVTEARFARALEGRTTLDTVIGFDRHGAHAGLAGIRRLVRSLPADRYRAIVDLQGKLRTRAFAKNVPAEQRLTLTKRSASGAVLSLLGRDPPIVDRHSVDLYLETLRPLGVAVESADRRPRFVRRPSGRREELLVGLGIGATHATKRWPIERFVALAKELHAEAPRARFVPIAGPAERDLVERLRQDLPGEIVSRHDVASLDVTGLFEVIEQLELMIGVDSGPAHLAAALGIPVIAIFGPTSPRRWGPIGEEHRVVTLDLSCSPCSNIGGERCPIPARAHECMTALSVERVLFAAREILAARRP